MVNIQNIAEDLIKVGQSEDASFKFDVTPIPSDVEVLKINVEDREEIPLFVSVSEEQILCMAYLFGFDEVKEESFADLNAAMLHANITMPLSAFSIIQNRYVIYGALSVRSSLEDITHELEVLSGNALEAIASMKNFLK